MWYLRRIMKISWTERKSNEDIKETVQYKKIFSQDYKKKTIRISRTYICRKNGIEKQMLCGKIESRRSRGRQRTTYIESLNKYTTRNSISIAELIRRTNDREAWRAMVVDVCSRPDTQRRKSSSLILQMFPFCQNNKYALNNNTKCSFHRLITNLRLDKVFINEANSQFENLHLFCVNHYGNSGAEQNRNHEQGFHTVFCTSCKKTSLPTISLLVGCFTHLTMQLPAVDGKKISYQNFMKAFKDKLLH